MVQNAATATIPESYLIPALGLEIASPDLTELQSQIQLFSIDPGTTFWQSSNENLGIYIILSGKIRLFDRQDDRLATLIVGQSFGESSLFPDADFQPYIAKSPLVVSRNDIQVGFIPRAAIVSLWPEYPEIQTYLSQTAQQFDRVVRGEIAPLPLIQSAPDFASRQSVTSFQLPALPGIETKIQPNATPTRTERQGQQKLSEAYFPTPKQKVGQWWQQVTHNYPFYAQQGASDCGAACIVMVGKYWGKELNINRLRELAYVSRDGASLKGLVNAVEKIGFNCRPVKASLARLANQKLPAIAHWQGNHYIVVFEITSQHVIVCDPAIGQRKLTHAEFSQGWTDFCLLLEPTLALEKRVEGKSTDLFQLFQLIAPHKVVIGEIFIASIVLQLFGLISPIFTQLILDRAVIHKSASSPGQTHLNLLLFKILANQLRI
jgi:predicted double-glycine peptidase/CRP-like cAMP-binding protein